jgi:hypothetical protein
MDEVDAGSVPRGKRAEGAHNPREFVSEATFRAKAKERWSVRRGSGDGMKAPEQSQGQS